MKHGSTALLALALSMALLGCSSSGGDSEPGPRADVPDIVADANALADASPKDSAALEDVRLADSSIPQDVRPEDSSDEDLPPDALTPPPDVQVAACTVETAVTDCDDANPCTDDLCVDGACQSRAKSCRPADSDDCDDWFCNPLDGECQVNPGALCPCPCMENPTICDDGNPCTTDTCNPDPSVCCEHELTPGGCDDNNPCVEAERCMELGDGSIGCGGGDPHSCDDGDACTLDWCDPTTPEGCQHSALTMDPPCDLVCDTDTPCPTLPTPCVDLACEDGACVPVFTTAACDDNNPCTTADTCEDGVCTGGPPPSCDDGDFCTEDACVPALGGCIHTDPGWCCEACTTADDCPDVSDNECVQAVCSPAGCCALVNIDASCSDEDACTEGDACRDGQCIPGHAVDCDDGDPDTTDTCDPNAGGCVFTPNGNQCPGVTGCASGTDCNDGDPCTTDSCLTYLSPSLCQCIPRAFCSCNPNAADGGAGECDNGDPCTIDTCVANSDPDIAYLGLCEHVFDAASCCEEPCTSDGQCDDGDKCTLNRCEALSEDSSCCIYPAIQWPCGKACALDSECGDGDPCTKDTCGEDGTCDPSVVDPAACQCISDDDCAEEDGNPCTTPRCVERDCVEVFNLAPCDDGDDCTINDNCDGAGLCTGDARSCDDGDECTTDECQQGAGCVHTFIEGCRSSCLEDPGSCDDGIPCTIDMCNPDGLCSHEDLNRDADTLLCVQVRCNDESDCDDGNPCTQDRCLNTDGNGDSLDADLRACIYDEIPQCDVLPQLACATDDDCDPASCVSDEEGAFCTFPNADCPTSRCDAEVGCRFLPNASCIFGGECSPETEQTDCFDGNACTKDICDPTTLLCDHSQENYIADGNLYADCESCSPEEPCPEILDLTDSPCVAVDCVPSDNPHGAAVGLGVCYAHIDQDLFPNACEDYDLCTIDACVPDVGCSHEPRVADCVTCYTDAACDDGDACTEDVCVIEDNGSVGFSCEHNAVPDCVACELDADCATDDFCASEQCVLGRCRTPPWSDTPGHGPVCVDVGCMAADDCDDFDDTTTDICVFGEGACIFVPDATLPAYTCHSAEDCFPPDSCTEATACNAGVCEFAAIPDCVPLPCDESGDCEDGDETTRDACSNGFCRHWTKVEGCETTTDCVGTLGEGWEACDTPVCGADHICHLVPLGGANRCGGECTTDDECQRRCDEETGICESFCLGDDECYDWPCSKGACADDGFCVYFDGDCETCADNLDCADPDPCTVDICDAGACTHTPDPACAPTPCLDQNICDSGDACVIGFCFDGSCVWMPNPMCE